jgi:integrase
MPQGPRLIKEPGRRNWYIRVTERGTTRRVSTHTPYREAAEEFLSNFKAALESPAGKTIGEILDARVKARSPYVARPEALREHATALKRYWGNKYPEQVEDHVRLCKNNRRQLEELRAALKLAEKRGWIEKTPHVELPPKSSPRDKFLTQEQGVNLLRSAHRPHIKLFILVAMTTGARKGAVLDLTWDRVDMDGGVIDFHNPKKFITNKKRSVVPVTRELITALREAHLMATTDYVIEWNGKPLKSIKTAFRKTAQRAGVPWCSPHVLKHTAITWLAQKGWGIGEISEFTETSFETVKRVYRHGRPENLVKQAEDLGSFLYTPCTLEEVGGNGKTL